MAIECDRCGVRFNLIHGGVCERCGRILCRAHLHGSWLRQLLVDVGAHAVCTDCRAGTPTARTSGDERPAAP
jgi:hypothetical protein